MNYRYLPHIAACALLLSAAVLAFTLDTIPRKDSRGDAFTYDFSDGLPPWESWMPSKPSGNGSVLLTAPGKLDPNHIDGIGALWLAVHLRVAAERGPGQLDMRGATVTIRMRSHGFEANGARLVWWISSFIPPADVDRDFPWQQTNWALTGADLATNLDGGWHEIETTFQPNPALWTYAGTNTTAQGVWGRRYKFLPLERTLAVMDATLHLAFVGARQDAPPRGTLEIDRITIRTVAPAPPYDFDKVMKVAIDGNWPLARPHLKRMADDGYAPAAFHYGRALKLGLGGNQDFAAATKYLQQSLEKVPDAAFELGEMYLWLQQREAGRALLSDPRIAHLPHVRHLLGNLHSEGDGGPDDAATATMHFRFAAEHGYAPAMLALALRYIDGAGVRPDPATAYFWLRLAEARMSKATHGFVVEVIQHNLARVGRMLEPSRILEINRRATAWTPSTLGERQASNPGQTRISTPRPRSRRAIDGNPAGIQPTAR